MLTPPRHVYDAGIPDKVDLREFLFPVEDIADTRAAVSAAVTTALEYHGNRTGTPPTDLSTLFVYYNARRLAGTENDDPGATMTNVMKAVATFGACREVIWPFDVGSLKTQPPAEAYEDGKRLTKIEFAEPMDPLQALSLRYPLPFLMKVVDRLVDEAGKTGVMPVMSPEELKQMPTLPVFATVLVGYDKVSKTFIARNCWGTQWGDDGYCRVPFDLVNALTSANAMGMWMIASPEASDVRDPAAAGSTGVPASAPQPETVAEMAARMRAEIRGDLQRDLADATRRVRDRVTSKPAAPMGSVGTRECSMCQGRGHWNCGARGCAGCNYTGQCPSCS